MSRTSRARRLRRAAALTGAVAAAATTFLPAAAGAAPLTDIDLSNYVRVGRYDLPEPKRTAAPAGNLLAQEASGVAYNPDTGTLFVVGDGGQSITQVTKTGQLVDTMTLPGGSSPQGTEFYDIEGIAYLGNGEFAFTEERDRQVVRFTYQGGTTLTRAQTKTVKLGTTIGNVGLEDVSNDPATGGLILAKEAAPIGIFQTTIDWDNGTASNGSPTTVNSTNLFDPALAGVDDMAGVFALSNLPTLSGPQSDNLLILSQESGKLLNISRSGAISSSLTLSADLDTPISIQDQTHEGVTMDEDGNIYIVSENGGGSIDFPQMWVFAPATAPNAAPTQVALINRTTSLAENTGTTTRVKVADVRVVDDGLGSNQLAVTGPDAADFEVDATGLYLKAGTNLDYETKTSYRVTVTVDDSTVGSTPDASTPEFTLSITDVPEGPSTGVELKVTEVAPWGSGNGTYGADWFEITNTGSVAVNLTGFRMDDGSNAFGNSVELVGVGNLAPGKSAVFVEGNASVVQSYRNQWFGGAAPSDFLIGSYSGSGVGLSTTADAVNVFDPSGARLTGVQFGASTSGVSFDNAAGIGSASLPLPTISTLSAAGVNGAFTVGTETGSPGRIAAPVALAVTEVSPWSSGNSPYAADWFELTNTGTETVNLSGYRMDDDSSAFANSRELIGVSSLAPGESAIFLEASSATPIAAFTLSWFGFDVPAGLKIGRYSGSGVGLSTGGDAVNVFNAGGDRITGVAFGASTSGRTFDNAAGAGSATLPLPVVSTLSTRGTAGAFLAAGEVGSPGTITPDTAAPTITFAGNQPSYTVDQLITITCSVTDTPRSTEVQTSTCPEVSARATTFPLGMQTLTAQATDYAGNSSTKTIEFEVKVATQPICTLMTRYVRWSKPYKALDATQQRAYEVMVVAPICRELAKARPGIDPVRRTVLIDRFKTSLRQLMLTGYLTHPQNMQLRGYADALPA